MQPDLIAVAVAVLLGGGLVTVAVAVAMAAFHPIEPPAFEPAPADGACCASHPLHHPMR